MIDNARSRRGASSNLPGRRLLGSLMLAALAACGSGVAADGTTQVDVTQADAFAASESNAVTEVAQLSEARAARTTTPTTAPRNTASGTTGSSTVNTTSGTSSGTTSDTSSGTTSGATSGTTSGASSGASSGSGAVSIAGRLFASGFENGVSVTTTTIRSNADQYLRGGDPASSDWSTPLFGTASQWSAWILSVVGQNTPLPASSYCENTIKTVIGRTGQSTRALSLNSKMQSPNTTVQQIAMQYANMPTEPVVYQRMWVKFDEQTQARATRIGPNDFYQIFWEMKAEPDYRIRLELRLQQNGQLYWHAQGDPLYNATALWSGQLRTLPVVIAPAASPQGWHKVEVWMDRPGRRFKAAINGATLVDYSGSLQGASGNRVNQLKTMMVYSDVAPIAETYFDDVEFWSQPPQDAWMP